MNSLGVLLFGTLAVSLGLGIVGVVVSRRPRRLSHRWRFGVGMASLTMGTFTLLLVGSQTFLAYRLFSRVPRELPEFLAAAVVVLSVLLPMLTGVSLLRRRD